MEEEPKNQLLNRKTVRESKKKIKQEKKENQNKKIKESKSIEKISEGKVPIKLIKLCNKDQTFSAFYNPAQELNRDLTVLSISTYMSFTK